MNSLHNLIKILLFRSLLLSAAVVVGITALFFWAFCTLTWSCGILGAEGIFLAILLYYLPAYLITTLIVRLIVGAMSGVSSERISETTLKRRIIKIVLIIHILIIIYALVNW